MLRSTRRTVFTVSNPGTRGRQEAESEHRRRDIPPHDLEATHARADTLSTTTDRRRRRKTRARVKAATPEQIQYQRTTTTDDGRDFRLPRPGHRAGCSVARRWSLEQKLIADRSGASVNDEEEECWRPQRRPYF